MLLKEVALTHGGKKISWVFILFKDLNLGYFP